MRRVHWMELFFDLVFVAFIGQLAYGLHGDPSGQQFLGFLVVFAIGWWAWINVTTAINVLPNLPERRLAVVMLWGTMSVGAMAVAAPAALGDRAWVFALGCGALRLVLLPLWFSRAKSYGQPLWRPLAYNGLTAALWIGSAFVPQPAQFGVWFLAIALEVSLITVGSRGTAPLADDLDIGHLSERLGLFVILVMGESVFSIIAALNKHWGSLNGVTALLGMLLISTLAWDYFLLGARYFEAGLKYLLAERRTLAIRDAVMFMPYALVAGVTMVSAGLATAISAPQASLNRGGAIALFVGVACFYATTGAVSIRMGRTQARDVRWVLLASALSLAALVGALMLEPSALLAVAAATGIVTVVTALKEVRSRRAAVARSGQHG